MSPMPKAGSVSPPLLTGRTSNRSVGAAIATHVRVAWDDGIDDLRATTELLPFYALPLGAVRTAAPPGPETTVVLVAHAVSAGLAPLGWSSAARVLQARAGWARAAFGEAWPACSDDALVADVDVWLVPLLGRATGRADLERIDMAGVIRSRLGGLVVDLDRLVPKTVLLASGKSVPVTYDGERPRLAVRRLLLEDLYGTSVHPTIVKGRIPVTVEVLSPAGRPIQITGATSPGSGTGAGRWSAGRWRRGIPVPRLARRSGRCGPWTASPSASLSVPPARCGLVVSPPWR